MHDKMFNTSWELNSDGSTLAKHLFSDSDFSDVTLVCNDGQQVAAHRAVLAASSGLLRRLLMECNQKNTFLFMGMVDFEVLSALVQFTYLGFHDLVEKKKLEQLTSLANQLEISMSGEKAASEDMKDGIMGPGYESNGAQGGWTSTAEEGKEKIEEKHQGGLDLENGLGKVKDMENVGAFVAKTNSHPFSEIQKKVSRTLYKVEPSENSKFKCDECGCEYSKRASLIKHRLHLHDGFSYDCELCGEKFSRSSKLRMHKISVHQGLSFDCNNCDRHFADLKRLSAHQSKAKKTCQVCKFVACNYNLLVKHMATHDALYENDSFSCSVCPFRARKRTMLKNHIKFVHEKFRLSCDLCDFKSKDKSAIREHKTAVHEGIKLLCDQCDYQCNMKKQMFRHTRMTHGDIVYDCELCDFKTKDKSILSKHEKNVHEKLRRVCPMCDISVAYNTSLRRHIRQVHEGVKQKATALNMSCKGANCCVDDDQNAEDGQQ